MAHPRRSALHGEPSLCGGLCAYHWACIGALSLMRRRLVIIPIFETG